jgi:predicted Zn-dependent protease with MMP-like domain
MRNHSETFVTGMNDETLRRVAQQTVEATLAEMPPTLWEVLRRCPVRLYRWPGELDEGLDEDLMGLFEGVGHDDGEPGTADEMPRISLFLENIWDEAEGDGEEFRVQVRITLLHEIGHYLGWDEDEVAERGLE